MIQQFFRDLCCGLNEKCSPEAHEFEHLVSSGWGCLVRFWNLRGGLCEFIAFPHSLVSLSSPSMWMKMWSGSSYYCHHGFPDHHQAFSTMTDSIPLELWIRMNSIFLNCFCQGILAQQQKKWWIKSLLECLPPSRSNNKLINVIGFFFPSCTVCSNHLSYMDPNLACMFINLCSDGYFLPK